MTRPTYRVFDTTVARRADLSPHFVRITLTASDLDQCGGTCLDQRAKLVFCTDDQRAAALAALESGSDWLTWWYAADPQPPMRTYTVKAVRPEACEVDIDFVRHGATGPAGTFAEAAEVGDRVLFVGPDASVAEAADSGVAWCPGHARDLLLVGDETAAPAVLSIVESLSDSARAVAVIEVPTTADVLPVGQLPAGVEVIWVPREVDEGESNHDQVRRLVSGWAAGRGTTSPSAPDDGPEMAGDLIWDEGSADQRLDDWYVWIAGESSMVTGLRRLLVNDHGLDKRRIAFMGYWKHGVAAKG